MYPSGRQLHNFIKTDRNILSLRALLPISNSVENVWRVPELLAEKCQAVRAGRECSQKLLLPGAAPLEVPISWARFGGTRLGSGCMEVRGCVRLTWLVIFVCFLLRISLLTLSSFIDMFFLYYASSFLYPLPASSLLWIFSALSYRSTYLTLLTFLPKCILQGTFGHSDQESLLPSG